MINTPIIALDFSNYDSTIDFLRAFDSESLYVKVGMELFYQTGPELIAKLKGYGHKIFLDLKLHDIPNTVHHAMKGLARLDVDMVNVHAAGGSNMMKAALTGLEAGTEIGKKRPLLIAVTQLTSTSEEQMKNEQLIEHSILHSVLHYAKLTYQSGLDGVVCSAIEAREIEKVTNKEFLRVTPGIRLEEDSIDDQKRVVTPQSARKIGSSAIVVGRTITKSADPLQTYLKVKQLWEGNGND
ncbi:orotidine-5'-phosphate decarboxylase [Heyndrickxia sporothermodurans]|uniref:orotidine-5'-phosphate decarboxylase n=1 Tax=Heyndrickxia sporothermodurans TaxID=46224 RepID=UPI002DBE2D39|nr:orotidine-5'-phosphate decarboxylase [Heyndrickxia sporothermodurans]MEB6548123.1 orotidine-5'-phosphate decarboxylase [Heyndrickxia sporothermodurans]MED3650051.1 orotidine-5'-phosphate decarboxylase [Heyndrickxia sporothermodurans]MED3698037.1 orotidine-5'-phosphate decarboxylase [Heyndrickxia sporothermodurans]